jgi:multiple sugar transport system ATP-binding protein
VRENIAFPLTLAKMSKEEINRKVDEAARILDLTQHMDRKPANLSGGQRQRVAMGRAIVRSPKAFLMDEPLSNLDAKLRVQMRTEISRLQKRLGTTTVYVTHDQTEAMTLGDRVVVMRGGLVQQVGAPQELYDRPANLFVAGFIGSPSMNFVSGQLEAADSGGVVHSAIGDIPIASDRWASIRDKNPGRDVVIGIRPEHFEDADLLAADQRDSGVTFTADIDVLESMGSDKYAYFTVDDIGVSSQDLDELAADVGVANLSGGTTVARLPVESAAAQGHNLRMWFDPRSVSVFDLGTGVDLTL